MTSDVAEALRPYIRARCGQAPETTGVQMHVGSVVPSISLARYARHRPFMYYVPTCESFKGSLVFNLFTECYFSNTNSLTLNSYILFFAISTLNPSFSHFLVLTALFVLFLQA